MERVGYAIFWVLSMMTDKDMAKENFNGPFSWLKPISLKSTLNNYDDCSRGR